MFEKLWVKIEIDNSSKFEKMLNLKNDFYSQNNIEFLSDYLNKNRFFILFLN